VLVIGLTGSIGMGKSTTAGMFRSRGVPVHDADHAVHQLYRGEAIPAVAAAFPEAIHAGVVDRARLSGIVAADPGALARLEEIVHPLVREREEQFLAGARASGYRLALLDIPLLIETGSASRVHVVLVVTASAETQKLRVLNRPGMTEAKFEALRARQVPDAEKRRRAHVLVDTEGGLASAARQVEAILRMLAAS
jgi:dephospho-CoA kinase